MLLLQPESHRGCLFATVGLLGLLFVGLTHRLLGQLPVAVTSKHLFNISEAYIITLDAVRSVDLQARARQHLGVDTVHLFSALNGTEALRLTFDGLPLYTKLLVELNSRHDHMQISSGPMLGCLLSHMEIWRRVLPNTIVAVLEEDAIVDITSAERISALSDDLVGERWDLLMLESGQVTATGEWRYVGQVAATCAHPRLRNQKNTNSTPLAQGAVCTWQGSRGYLISHAGAQQLLKFATPIMVQVDALMGLVATFEPDFLMYWPRVDVVRRDLTRMSTIWDACIKCYLPTSLYFYGLLLAACVLARPVFVSLEKYIK
jgi:GR25 family glycosyltransferase involved in LPS biosynthesis